MDFAYSESQTQVKDLAKKIFAEKVTPKSLKTVEASEGSEKGFDRKLWSDLAAAGLLGVALPEEANGSGHGFLELCALLEQAGAAVAPVPLWPALVLGALPIAKHGTEAQKRRWLDGVADGKRIWTAALIEATVEDPASPTTRAERAPGGWQLFGEKTCVPAAFVATNMLVVARDPDGVARLFAIDPRGAGVKLERQIATTGELQARMTLTGAPAAEDDVLPAPALSSLLQHATVALCALELGVAERALRMTAEYTSQRKQFDRPIATFQAVAQRLADSYIDVETIRVTTWQAAWQLAEGRDATDAVLVAKWAAADAGHRVVYAAQHLHGGIGFDRDYPLHRHYLWSKQLELSLGNATESLVRLGAHLARGV